MVPVRFLGTMERIESVVSSYCAMRSRHGFPPSVVSLTGRKVTSSSIYCTRRLGLRAVPAKQYSKSRGRAQVLASQQAVLESASAGTIPAPLSEDALLEKNGFLAGLAAGNEAGEPTAVLVPIELWREIASERETAYLLKPETMRHRLLAALAASGRTRKTPLACGLVKKPQSYICAFGARKKCRARRRYMRSRRAWDTFRIPHEKCVLLTFRFFHKSLRARLSTC
jgi:hypothetical protein